MKRITDEIRTQARQLRKEGLSYRDIGTALGFTGCSIHKALDPHYAEKRRTQINLARAFRTADMQVAGPRVRYMDSGTIREDAAARLAEIPPDTRDLTATLLGDPIPNDPRRYWLNGSAR